MLRTPKAKRQNPVAQDYFRMGPDCDHTPDLRVARPYFLVPLERETCTGEQDLPPKAAEVLKRVVEHVNGSEEKPITDVYVISHGWHRTFYTAVSGYDRLISRFAVLFARGRLDPPGSTSEDKQAFNPLFLAAHWHSDPGPENFWDPDGRRHKEAFLQSAQLLFESNSGANFTNDFEDIFEYLSCIAAPGGKHVLAQDPDEAQGVTTKLCAYTIRDRLTSLPPPDATELISIAWRCYNETKPKGLLLDQDTAPGRNMAFSQAAKLLLGFLVTLLGPLAVLAWLKSQLPKVVTGPFSALWEWAWDRNLWAARALANSPSWLVLVTRSVLSALLFYLPIFLIGVLYLYVAQRRRTDQTYGEEWTVRKARGYALLSVLAFAAVELPLAVLLAVFCLFTYLFGRWVGRAGLWDERCGHRNATLKLSDNPIRPSFRERIAYVVRGPIWWLMRASATDTFIYRTCVTIDAQLSAPEMQRKGAETGGRLAIFLHELFKEWPDGQKVRLHMVGHSYGGVVVANAARRLALDSQAITPVLMHAVDSERPFQTLCTVQGAMASAWYDGEKNLLEKVNKLAAVYTRYDTATGFIYSFGFNARLAIGSVGIFLRDYNRENVVQWRAPLGTNTRTVYVFGHEGEFATLTSPPMKLLGSVTTPCVLNLDASRFEYEGPPQSGGAHSDIFKDDLICLLWAVFHGPVAASAGNFAVVEKDRKIVPAADTGLAIKA